MPVYNTYVLSAVELEQLTKPVKGSGGYQSYIRRLQGSLEENTLSVTRDDFEWLADRPHLILEHNGGWQGQIPDRLKEDVLDFATSP